MFLRVIAGLYATSLMISSVLAADVEGDWNMIMSAAEGAAMVPMTITVDGETATATAGQDKFTGTYKNGKLKLKGSLYVPDAGMSSTMGLTATLVGDQLKGIVNWDMYVADLVGTRK